MLNFAGRLTTPTVCVQELESPCLRTLCSSLVTENLSVLCTLIIYLLSMGCLMLTRSNIVSNKLNGCCSQLDSTQRRMVRPTGEFSAEHLRLPTDWQLRRVCWYKKLLLIWLKNKLCFAASKNLHWYGWLEKGPELFHLIPWNAPGLRANMLGGCRGSGGKLGESLTSILISPRLPQLQALLYLAKWFAVRPGILGHNWQLRVKISWLLKC